MKLNQLSRLAILSAALMGAGYASAAPADDDALAMQVTQALQQAHLQNSDFKVVAHEGRVDLRGWVNAPNDVDSALHVAKGVPGVRMVQSNLRTWSTEDINEAGEGYTNR